MMTNRLIGLSMVTGIDAAGTDLNSEIVIDWEPKCAAFVRTQNDCPAPLEQSWAYGDAIAAVSNNNIWRGVIDIDGTPVATVQTAERRLPTGLKLVQLDQRGRDTDLFIAEYLKDRRAQKYSGPSSPLVQAIAEAFGKDIFWVQALDHGNFIAASLYMRHGKSETYDRSWTTNHGRERNATHFLMWEGIKQLKEASVSWLDLGGMDARATGIAHFKIGVGAAPVTTGGTWF